MNEKQLLSEIRKELAANSRLAHLLIDFGKCFADTALRVSYKTNEPALLIRQAGMGEGVEKFCSDITKAPTVTAPEHPDHD